MPDVTISPPDGASASAAATATADAVTNTSTSPPSWAAGILDSAAPGALIADWHTKAPEPAKWEPYKGAKSLEELLTMAEKRVGDAQAALRSRPATPAAAASVASLPARPEPGAAPEAWQAWREAHGLPGKPEDYGITRPDDFPEQLWNDDEAAEFMRFAHERDLSPELVKALAGWQQDRARHFFADRQRHDAESFAKLQADEAAALARLFGPRLDTTLKDLQAIAQATGARPSWFDPRSTDFAGVELVDFFAKLRSRIPRGEDATRRHMGDSRQSPAYDLAWAKVAIRQGHPDYEALTNPKHPQHAELTELRNQAYAVAQES